MKLYRSHLNYQVWPNNIPAPVSVWVKSGCVHHLHSLLIITGHVQAAVPFQGGFYTDVLRRTGRRFWLDFAERHLFTPTGIHESSERARTLPTDQRASMVLGSPECSESIPEIIRRCYIPLFYSRTARTTKFQVPLSESLRTHHQLKEANVRMEVL